MFSKLHPRNSPWNLENNDGFQVRNLQTSKGPPFSGEPCLFWGGVYYIHDGFKYPDGFKIHYNIYIYIFTPKKNRPPPPFFWLLFFGFSKGGILQPGKFQRIENASILAFRIALDLDGWWKPSTCRGGRNIHPPEQTAGTWKWEPLGKGDSYWKPSFPGSMLNFGGVYFQTVK